MNVEGYWGALSPELILLVGACAALIVGALRSPAQRRWVSPVTALVVLLAIAATIRNGVPDGAAAPFGLWLTSLTYYTRLIALGLGVMIVLVNWSQPAAEERGEYMSMILFSLLGVLLTASANDWVVLFFAIELVSVPTYVLIALSRLDGRAAEATVKYFFLGAMSAAILAYGLSFLYGVGGTTTIHRVTEGVATAPLAAATEARAQMLLGFLLVFAGLSFKIAAVPLHVYAPDVYEGAASPVTGLLGFVPKFAGFVALIKVFTACNWDLPVTILWVVWAVAVLTMTMGNVLALLQRNAKRILAYSSIAHTGYMLIALLVGPIAGEGPMRDGVVALLFYVAVYGAMNLGAFALLAAYERRGQSLETLEDLAGMARRAPAATLALAICLFSLMGFPPTAGFLGKLYIFSSAFSVPTTHPFHGPLLALAIIGVINSVIGAAYYLRITSAAYIGESVEPPVPVGGVPVRLGLALCSIPMLVVFVWPGGLVSQARLATGVVHRSLRHTTAQLTERSESADRPPSDSVAPAAAVQTTRLSRD